LADSIRLQTKERPNGISYPSAPAIKLGRMGVQTAYRGRGVGPWIIDNVVGLALEIGSKVGVRYVTLDALQRPKLLAMYEGYGFLRNKAETKTLMERFGLKSEKQLHMISMRYDIRP